MQELNQIWDLHEFSFHPKDLFFHIYLVLKIPPWNGCEDAKVT
jgi:hypothetical protein